MIASRQFKSLLAGVAAVALMGSVMAQGNPPNPAIKSAPVGAGQQSTQKSPMGETGTQAATGSMPATSNTTSAGSTSSSMGSTAGGTSMGSSAMSDTTVASSRSSKRRMRADRN